MLIYLRDVLQWPNDFKLIAYWCFEVNFVVTKSQNIEMLLLPMSKPFVKSNKCHRSTHQKHISYHRFEFDYDALLLKDKKLVSGLNAMEQMVFCIASLVTTALPPIWFSCNPYKSSKLSTHMNVQHSSLLRGIQMIKHRIL